MSLLVIFEILGLFVNISTAHHNYYFCNKENLHQSIQMILSKQKTLSELFASFLKPTSSFEHYEEKDDSHSLSFSKITECERCG